MANWLPDFKKRIAITCSNTNVDANCDHFPVLIHLCTGSGTGDSDTTCVFGELMTGGNDLKIAVTESDGVTQLYVEIEKWSDASEEAYLWVSSSGFTLASGAETVLYLYYDKNHADNTDYVGTVGNRTEVWDSYHVGVFHLSDASGNFVDSTSNSNDAAVSGSPTYGTSVAIGDGVTFDPATSDYADLGTGSSLNSQYITLEAWAKPDVAIPSSDCHIVNRDNENPGTAILFLDNATGKYIAGFRLEGNEGSQIQLMTDAAGGTGLTHLAATYDGDNAHLYRDGVQQTDTNGTNGTLDTDSFSSFQIGARENPDLFWDGDLDEIRISSIARSTAWIKADYYAQTDALASYGSEEIGFIPRVVIL